MRVLLATLNLDNLPGVVEEYKREDRDLLDVMFSIAQNNHPRNKWLLENCAKFEIEEVENPFGDKVGLDLSGVEIVRLYGILDPTDEEKIVEFKLRFL
jgi:hypothetical protein